MESKDKEISRNRIAWVWVGSLLIVLPLYLIAPSRESERKVGTNHIEQAAKPYPSNILNSTISTETNHDKSEDKGLSKRAGIITGKIKESEFYKSIINQIDEFKEGYEEAQKENNNK